MLAKRKPGETGESWHTHLRPHGLCHLLFGAMKNGWEKVSKKELGKLNYADLDKRSHDTL